MLPKLLQFAAILALLHVFLGYQLPWMCHNQRCRKLLFSDLLMDYVLSVVMCFMVHLQLLLMSLDL